MKLEVKETNEVPLLSRTRVTLSADFQGPTPAREELRKVISKQLGKEEKLIIIKHIYTKFGQPGAKIIANVYKNEDELKGFEEKAMIKKHIKEEKKPAEGAEAAPEAPKEEAKAEAKEEKKVEEKPAEAKTESPKPKAEKPKKEAKPKVE
jgi:small subunit ribosomal protein S24e